VAKLKTGHPAVTHHYFFNLSKQKTKSKVWTLFSGWGYGGKLVTLSGLLVVFYLNKNFK
jgi:hypothetical protein